MRVLIVDDATFMRNFLMDNIKKLGYEVVGEASNGKEAIEKYIQLKPDLVTMDITMPKMNGIEALKEIKKINKNAKVIMISDIGQHDKIIESIKNGATDFIIKPVHPERLKDSLSKVGA
ncbi:two-component system, chemotaxis family, response regulator CheY [Alkalithermobacter thermoalcaliphilus JW-YL-7 = DSM 7308]|uniref:Stage 0 sporulation protein A homolog n=1 Tax=Alkalithermobacter thermoalcaliphilus JW-YL-7 = DSM 7308 TaxID=1121328 RepID=A0A150FNC4_CLOPD|nr:response regulator receiver protein [[Clostridium] paradoxum JW-YL-7 = DSM 7308]SHK90180.1 two-component system, chemotaxis family, response regulator CheY [[Clostridium] paradoxum JW-YL-7 = DSM 7308]